MKRGLHTQWLGRIAWVVLLLAALVPTVSRALAATSQGPDSPYAAICFSMASPAGMNGPASPDGNAMLDCPLCVLQAQGLAPGPHVDASPRLLALGDVLPPLFLRAPRPLFAWAPAQARAPPRRA